MNVLSAKASIANAMSDVSFDIYDWDVSPLSLEEIPHIDGCLKPHQNPIAAYPSTGH
jgi:hypothetical protein